MIALALLALIAVAAAQDTTAAATTAAAGATTAAAECTTDDAKTFGDCGTAIGKCTQDSGSDTTKICACYSAYIKCIDAKASLKNCAGYDSVKKGFVDACNVLKCTTCNSSSGLVASMSLVAAAVAARFL